MNPMIDAGATAAQVIEEQASIIATQAEQISRLYNALAQHIALDDLEAIQADGTRRPADAIGS